ncbi:ClpXP adapter SpxH family protein [Halalkalibacter hemicellulosilyticus]|uniref:ClpXP adapter protein SpxH n=1 Tax=Halalkalibacter hemicellulosilyticusJCM 9152 TaxID=1236971 RepID=W4QKR7_9BACI|nr:ClpXP adapter SpxH family protein [Halalkalibacter hemicellulosilyticus]GAE32691.1 YjbH-like, GTP pyrophosphokinase domain [Halalkalibacter hemicellulosilyticusJCM 9152]
MNRKDTTTTCDQLLGICGLDPNEKHHVKKHKPIEIYTFIDPLCADCWAFEPILKKLQIQYSRYFRIRILVAGRLEAWNACKKTEKGLTKTKQEIAKIWEDIASKSGMSCDGDFWLEHDLNSPYLASVAIKAAELQGPHAGKRFLRKMREALFLEKQDITNQQVLLKCAEQAKLDLIEFKQDLTSKNALEALQSDVHTTHEMGVDVVPTFVFFNVDNEEDGIKITGKYPYHVYEGILEDLLGFKPEANSMISLEEFLQLYGFVSTIEVAVVFNLTEQEAEKKLKALMLQQKVESVPVKYGMFWRTLN